MCKIIHVDKCSSVACLRVQLSGEVTLRRVGDMRFMFRQTRGVVLGAVVTSLACLSAPAQTQNGVTNSTKNPQQIATLHWYAANLTTAFSVGTTPFGVAFDGANVWVVNGGDNDVEKLRANDGAVLGAFSVGQSRASPRGLAFDGENVWVSNSGGNDVTELRGQRRLTARNVCGRSDPG